MSVTREKIIELGENLILSKGYNAFSYQDISTELGIKNAAIHYYFPTKANLGTSIVKTNIQRFEEMIDNMHGRGFDEVQQLDAFVRIYIKSNREHKICLVGSLSPAFVNLSESTQKELAKLIDLITTWLAGILVSGRKKGLFKFDAEPADKATIIFSSLVASLQLSRAVDSIDYKHICASIVGEIKP